MAEKFLEQIAEYYVSKGVDLSNYTMVFPNRRSAMFMRRYLKHKLNKTTFLPKMVSITYFTQMFCDDTIAEPLELLFELYNAYRNVLKRYGRENQIPDFDGFYFWGSILLDDFNDIDSYMVDTSMLFSNIKSLNEISANYLTDEQIEALKIIWGKNYIDVDKENFWNHVPTSPKQDSPSEKFLSLWQILNEVYEEFHCLLAAHTPKITYSGWQSRQACRKIRQMNADDFGNQRFAFIGFNVLSISRTLIFRHLKDIGKADFFWDIASPMLSDSDGRYTPSGRFIMPLSKEFKMPFDFDLRPSKRGRHIKIVGVPSSTGQTKVVSNLLSERFDTDAVASEALKDSPDNTAIVLADEKLLMPMLYSMPESVSTINVTMGLPYSTTPFASLMSAIISMHLRARIVKGEYTFFYQDVLNVVSHGHIDIIYAEEARSLALNIQKKHLYNISATEILNEYPEMAPIFSRLDNLNDINHVRDYILGLVDCLINKLSDLSGKKETYEIRILEGYRATVEKICILSEEYQVNMMSRTFLQMLERTLAISPVNFAGTPLSGLQIMSINDTRALDFDNLFILSTNEKVFPRSNYTPSLIPATLRSAYSLPTREHEESSSAYQFNRLISRADSIYLLFDNRTSGITTGEMSRYLAQLVYLPTDDKVTVHNLDLPAHISTVKPIIIEKTENVLAELRRFREGGNLNLSASALKTYINCPLEFYLKYVKGVKEEEETLEYVDAASYGTAMHETLRRLYAPYRHKAINEETIKILLNSDITRIAREELDKSYYKNRFERDLDRMPGEGKILSRIIEKYIKIMLQKEADGPDFTLYESEMGEKKRYLWKIDDQYTINFKMSVDRVDLVRDATGEQTMRFIDYKTGGDHLKAKLDNLFLGGKDFAGGIFQLLVYSYAYSEIFGYKGKIKPLIYKFQTMATEGIPDLVVGKTVINDYKDVENEKDNDNKGFRERFNDMINHIFEEEGKYPFTQAEKDENCTYCAFKQLCQREKK